MAKYVVSMNLPRLLIPEHQHNLQGSGKCFMNDNNGIVPWLVGDSFISYICKRAKALEFE